MIIGKEGLEVFYREHEDPWYFSWRAYQHYRYEQYIKVLKKHVPVGGTLLDIGCGKGYFANQLSKTGLFPFVVGVDISENAIKQAKKLFLNNKILSFQVQELPAINIENKQFDVVVALEVIYYLPEGDKRQEAIKNIFNLVKDGGFGLISVELVEKHITLNQIIYLLKDAGFIFVEVEQLKNGIYARQERNLCWVYDLCKELQAKAKLTYPLIVSLKFLIKFILSSKIIAKIGMFLTKFSYQQPDIIFFLVKK